MIQPKIIADNELGKPASLLKFVPLRHNELIHWNLLSSTNVLFCSEMLNCPRHNAETYLRSALSSVIRQVIRKKTLVVD